MMRRLSLCLIFGLALVVAAAAEVEEDSGAPFADELEDNGFLESSPQWREIVGKIRKSVDRPGLLRARRWGNIANGALLVATGPVSLTINLLGLKLSKVVLSLYVSVFGGVLSSVEMGLAPVAPWVQENMSYLTTATGRTALLAFLGGLTWPLGKLGIVPALLTCVNAIFNANFQRLLAFVEADDIAAGPGLEQGAADVDDGAGEAPGSMEGAARAASEARIAAEMRRAEEQKEMAAAAAAASARRKPAARPEEPEPPASNQGAAAPEEEEDDEMS